MNAAAEAAGDDDVAICPGVPVSQPVSVTRRHHRRPPEQPHLAAMGMPRELQRDPRRHAHRDVGLVRQKDDRRVVGHFR